MKYLNKPYNLAGVSFLLLAMLNIIARAESPPTPVIFNNVLDFEGQPFSHISFDPPDERTSADIVAKFPNVTSFTITGNAKILHTLAHISPSSGGDGNAGGPVSGEYRIDWGVLGTTRVTIIFDTPVDAVGAFFGGDCCEVQGPGDEGVFATLEDGTVFRASRILAGLVGHGDIDLGSDHEPELDGCRAINGFVGIDSNGGSRITAVTFKEVRDLASLDSIFFGTAVAGSHGPGPTLFPEVPFTSPPCERPPVRLPTGEPLIADAGTDKIFSGVPVTIGGSPTAAGGYTRIYLQLDTDRRVKSSYLG